MAEKGNKNDLRMSSMQIGLGPMVTNVKTGSEMLYNMPEATLEPVSSNVHFKSQFTHLFNYNVQALEILSKGFCVCVCVSGIT